MRGVLGAALYRRAVRSELISRLTLGPVFAGIAIGLILTDLWVPGHWGATTLGILVVLLSGWEFPRLMRPLAPNIQLGPIAILGSILVLTGWAIPNAIPFETGHISPSMLILGVALLWTSLVQMARHGLDNFVPNVTGTLFGLLYIGGANHLLCSLAAITTEANPHRGAQLLILVIAACKMGDTFAYFGGRAFGKTKLCPSISPGKTRAGFVASVVGSVVGVALFHWIFTATMGTGPLLHWWHAIIWGVIVGPTGALGDLLESCLKRSVDAKDSSNLLPGFGGFLDVFDAVLLAAPIGCIVALLF